MTFDLNQKLTAEEYEANREAIVAAVTAKDAAFIRNELGMTDWVEYYRHRQGVVAECRPSRAFWKLWRKDRIQLTKRLLKPTRGDGRGWMVECHDWGLSELLIG